MENATVGVIVNGHYLPEKRERRRANTVEGYESSLRLHVLPAFGTVRLCDLDRDDVQAWVDSFERPGAAEKAYKCLRQVVRWAIRKWGLLIPDVTIGVELPRKPAHRPRVLTARESRERIRGMHGFELEATVIIQHALGTRPGECYALDWEDIDKRTGEVDISKTLQQVCGGCMVYPTKTPKSERVGQLPKWALERLRQIWRDLGRPTGRIIGPLSPSAVAGRIRRHARRMGLPEVTMQNLRHTWATLALEAQVPIEVIASMLGHTDLNTPYRYYMQTPRAIRVDAQRQVERHLLAT